MKRTPVNNEDVAQKEGGEFGAAAKAGQRHNTHRESEKGGWRLPLLRPCVLSESGAKQGALRFLFAGLRKAPMGHARKEEDKTPAWSGDDEHKAAQNTPKKGQRGSGQMPARS